MKGSISVGLKLLITSVINWLSYSWLDILPTFKAIYRLKRFFTIDHTDSMELNSHEAVGINMTVNLSCIYSLTYLDLWLGWESSIRYGLRQSYFRLATTSSRNIKKSSLFVDLATVNTDLLIQFPIAPNIVTPENLLLLSLNLKR